MNRIDRRGFVKTGLAASAALCLGSQSLSFAHSLSAPIQDEPKRYRKAVKIGMVNVEGSLKDKFQTLKELGFDGVEMDSPTDLKAEEVRAASEATGLPVHGVVDSIHWNKTLSHPDEAVRLEGLEGLKTAIRDSKAFGGTTVLLVPGVCNKEVTYEQAWERSIPLIKQALPLAEELGIDILFENVWNNFLTDPKETARYIDEFKSDRVGAYYDGATASATRRPLNGSKSWASEFASSISRNTILRSAKPRAGTKASNRNCSKAVCLGTT
jgi:hexulose-6-phosphate isomerase